jgi:uncharacterized integral membrane protein (TIGR00698 family)
MGATLLACCPGLLLCVAIAAVAFGLGLLTGSAVVWALLLGALLASLWAPPRRFDAGIDAAAKTVLRIGVALLGAQVSAEIVHSLDLATIAVMAGCIAAILGAALVLGRMLGLGRELALIAAGSVAICGASAAVAFAQVLARIETRERDVACTVGAVSVLSMIAMLLYPQFARLVGLDDVATGVFLGGTIQEVPHAVAAGYSVDPLTGHVATTIKMLRVALLGPTLMLVAMLVAARVTPADARPSHLPLFLVMFVLLAGASIAGLLPHGFTEATGHLSRFLLVVAMVAIGLKLEWRQVAAYGWRPVALLAALSALLVLLVGLFLLAASR